MTITASRGDFSSEILGGFEIQEWVLEVEACTWVDAASQGGYWNTATLG